MGDLAARRKGQLQELRTFEGSDREEADDLGPRHLAHHYQSAHSRRGAEHQVQRDGAESVGEWILRIMRRCGVEVRGEQSLEGLRANIVGASSAAEARRDADRRPRFSLCREWL